MPHQNLTDNKVAVKNPKEGKRDGKNFAEQIKKTLQLMLLNVLKMQESDAPVSSPKTSVIEMADIALASHSGSFDEIYSKKFSDKENR